LIYYALNHVNTVLACFFPDMGEEGMPLFFCSGLKMDELSLSAISHGVASYAS
jgi:hypothetical protein